MDIRFPDQTATLEELDALRALFGEVGAEEGWEREHGGAHNSASQRHHLLAGLHALNDRVGYISPGGLGALCRRLDVPPAEGFGVASFYSMFAFEPRPKRVVHVCTDLACLAAGGNDLHERLREAVGMPRSQSATAIWQESPCLGLCERAPAALVVEAGPTVHEAVIAPFESIDIVRALADGTASVAPEAPAEAALPVRSAGDVLTKRIGAIDPTNIDAYRSHGGYEALRRAIQIGQNGVLREVNESKLVGRGGAAFPAGRKWQAVASQPARPHYLVCNADESEPGTFKDRVILEGDPYSLIEAMTIAGYATSCEIGYVYLRGEYPRARAVLETAIETARAKGLLGDDIMKSGFSFDIVIVRGAGAYICGEETAIFNSIEGFRGEPRSKPPFPVEVGLFGKPTLVNNVETIVNVLPIVLGGGQGYSEIGTEGSTGTKLFCMSGAVAKPGVYEVTFGMTLRELLELAGGMKEGRTLRAILLGGAAGAFVGPNDLDLPLTFEGARASGATLGSGVVMVLDDTVDLGAFLRRIAAFFRDESCGQCVPCRVGTVRQEETIVRLTSGGARPGDEALLRDVGQVMRDSSICGLGQTAWNAIESAIVRLGALS